jgi:hypothetical protein
VKGEGQQPQKETAVFQFVKKSVIMVALALVSVVVAERPVAAQFDWTPPKISLPDISLPDIKVGGFTGYKTNKFDLMNQVSAGGWAVAWADDISETDAAQGIVAGGVSIALDNPEPFLEWVRELASRTVTSLANDAQQKFPAFLKDQIQSLAADAIRAGVQGHNPTAVLRNYDTVDFKAGVIVYSGGNYLAGNLVTPTGGLKPYIALRWRGSRNTNPGQEVVVSPLAQRTSFSIVNRTQYNVSFSLGSKNFMLNKGASGNYWVTGPSPAIRIWQVGSGYRDFSLANGGAYAFQVNPQTGQIENAYR